MRAPALLRRPLGRLRRRSVALGAVAAVAGCATLSQINIVSEPQELAMGAEFAAQLEKELVFYDDPEVNAYVDRLGQSLVRVSRRSDIPYTFRVVDTDDINAFAVPGGYLYVNRGLIEAAENESELAGVLGHEIGHVVGRHSARQITQAYGLQAVAALLLGENPGMLASVTAQIAATGAINAYSRDMEAEADTHGVQELYDAGIDPNGLASFFDKLAEMRGGGSSSVEKFFSTHPDPDARASAVRAQIAALPAKPGLRTDSAEFRSARSRVRR